MFPIGRSAVALAVAADWLDLLIYGTALAGALLVAAAVIAVVKRWGVKSEETLTPDDQLAHYRSLYKRGAISQEEFDRLRAVLGGEAPRPAVVPAPPVAAPTPDALDGPPPSPPPADGVRPE